jgi:uncharacterized protein
LLLATPLLAALPIPPPPARRINDFAGALSADARDRLERKLVAAEQQRSNQIVVALFRSLQGESLEDYSIRLARTWRAGQKGLDNGVVFLIFVDDRKMRLEVGYGLEPTLTDALAGSIIRDVVAPRFREGRLAEGIEAGLDAIGHAIAGTYRAPVQQQPAAQPLSRLLLDPGFLLVIIIFGVVGVVLVMSAVQGRRRGWTTGRHGWIVASPGFGGGSWRSGDSSSSSGSSDSFSAGGGDFGGGGASGDW